MVFFFELQFQGHTHAIKMVCPQEYFTGYDEWLPEQGEQQIMVILLVEFFIRDDLWWSMVRSIFTYFTFSNVHILLIF